MRQSTSTAAVKRRMKKETWVNRGQYFNPQTLKHKHLKSLHELKDPRRSRPQLHHQHTRRVDPEAGLPASPAGQQGALGGAAAAAAGAAAERRAQALTVGRETETHRGAEGAEAAAGGGKQERRSRH